MSYELLASASTVISFLTFIGILFWAFSKGRREAFASAAQLPFALQDEFEDSAEQRNAS